MNIDKAKALIKNLCTDTENAIRIAEVVKIFTEDDRITKIFNDTKEANVFNIIRGSLDYTLIGSVAKIYDTHFKTNSLHNFFYKLCMTSSLEELKNNDYIKKAKDKYDKFKEDIHLKNIKKLRHKFVAHSAIDRIKYLDIEVKYKHLYETIDKTIPIIQNLSIAVLDCDFENNEGDEQYSLKNIYKEYSRLFTNRLFKKYE